MITLTHPEGLAPTGIVKISPAASFEELHTRARQRATLLRQAVHFYAAQPPEGLGIPHNEVLDPLPDPDNFERATWQVTDFRKSQCLYVAAYRLDSDGQIPESDDALVGMLNLREWSTDTEILDWDVLPPYRYKGLGVGKTMLQGALGAVDPNTPLQLEVVRPNHRAIAIYQRLGFRPTGRIERYDSYDTDFLVYRASAGTVQAALGGIDLCRNVLDRL